LPRVFDGDFKTHILDAHEIYLRDSYIVEEKTEYEFIYSKVDPNKTDIIDVVINIKRTLGNENSDIPIKGIYTCIDECMIKDSLYLDMVMVDGNDRLEEAHTYLFKLPLERSSEPEENVSRETYALYIPFKINLLYPNTKMIEYRYSFKTNLRNMHLYSLTLNGRRKNSIKKITMNIRWNQNLAQERFIEFLSFKGTSVGVNELIEYLRSSIRNGRSLQTNRLRELGVIRSSIVTKEGITYSDTWENIEPYKLAGLIYVMNEDWRHPETRSK